MLRSFHAPAMAQAPGRHARRARFSRARLLLLLTVQGPEAAAGDLHDLEADARDVADGVDAAAFPDGGVRLLRLDADLLDDDALGVGGAAEGVALVLRAEVRLLVVLVRPELRAAADHHLTGRPDPARLVAAAHLLCGVGRRARG